MAQDLTLEQIQNFKGKYPKQIWYMFLVEMWERFCFYGMRGVLTIFMADKIAGGLGLSEKAANLQYGTIQAFVYAFTFLGGIFADRILGFKRSLVFGALVMITGNFIIAFNPHDLFYLGITCSIIGTGFFKPNITSMVGFLYQDGDNRRDAGFSLFYSGINLGALLGGAICVGLGTSQKYGWRYAFIASGAVMVIGLITFLLTKKYIKPIGNKPDENTDLQVTEVENNMQVVEADVPVKQNAPWKEYAVYAIGLLCIPLILQLIKNANFTTIFMGVLAAVVVIYFIIEVIRQKGEGVKSKLIAAFIFCFFYFVFETFFEQAGGSLAIFAKNNLSHDMMGLFSINPNIVNNSANSFFVIILGLVAGLFWLWLAKRKAEPNTIIKFGISFLFMALSYYCYYYLRFTANESGTNASLGVFTFAYLLVSIAEICLSPIGMSVVTKLSPKKMQGLMIGMWFVASAYGQYGAGLLGADMSSDSKVSNIERLLQYTAGYKKMAWICVGAGILLIVCSPLIKKLMRGVR